MASRQPSFAGFIYTYTWSIFLQHCACMLPPAYKDHYLPRHDDKNFSLCKPLEIVLNFTNARD
jgi:hypothetical protein